MTDPGRLHAIVPAAGHSRRMGRQKLLLKLGDRAVITRLLDVLKHDAIASRVVVMRRDDSSLAAAVAVAGATAVQPEIDPPDMRNSVERGLEFVGQNRRPAINDGWLLIPADHPVLDAAVVDLLINTWKKNRERIAVPIFQGRRGHPTVFPWSLASEVFNLPTDAGLNMLLHAHEDSVFEVPVASSAVVTDLDTPEDFETLVRQFEMSEESS